MRKIITAMRKKPNVAKSLSHVNQEEEETNKNVPVSIVGIASLDEEREPLLTVVDIS